LFLNLPNTTILTAQLSADYHGSDASIDGRDNDIVNGRFNGKLTKVGGTETMYIKASSFKQLPKAN